MSLPIEDAVRFHVLVRDERGFFCAEVLPLGILVNTSLNVRYAYLDGIPHGGDESRASHAHLL